MRILIAEDDPASRLTVRRILEREGYEVVEAEDGDQAWHVLSADNPPRLVILDWMMPGLNGVEICQRLRERSEQPYIYTVLLTSRSSRGDVLDAFAKGADDYLVKPVDAAELASRLRAARRILELQAALLRVQAELQFKAAHDPLTGVLNHERIVSLLAVEAERATRAHSPLSAVMADLDHFKHINDTYGHPTGDAVLREVARRLNAQLRPYDAVGRYGGEEFLIVLPQATLPEAEGVAERLLHAVAGLPIQTERHRVSVTLSLGVSGSSGKGIVDPARLVASADQALYRAKANGRARYESQALAPAAA